MSAIPTNRGAMTPEQIGAELTYRHWLWNRDALRVAERHLRGFFGDTTHEEFERRYRAERAVSDSILCWPEDV